MSESTVSDILLRNARVDADKAWEISRTRRACVALFTYCVAVLLFFRLGSNHPFADALVPLCGYLLSTVSFSFVKHFWIRYFYEKK